MDLLTPDHSVKAAGGEVLGFWPACGDHQAHRRAPTGFLLQPLFLWSSPLRQKLPFAVSVCTPRHNWGQLRPQPYLWPEWRQLLPVSLWSIYTGESEVSSREDKHCWSTCLQAHMGGGWASLVVWRQPLLPLPSLSPRHAHQEKRETSTEVYPQVLRHVLNWDGDCHHIWEKPISLGAPAPPPGDPSPGPKRAVTATEHWRSPSWHLSLALPNPVSAPTKGVAPSTPWAERQLRLNWELALPQSYWTHTDCIGCSHIKTHLQGTSLVVQWLQSALPVQGAEVWSWVKELDPMCHN